MEASGYSDVVAFKYYLAFLVWSSLSLVAFGYPAFTSDTDASFLTIEIIVLSMPVVGMWVLLYRAYKKECGAPFFCPFFTIGWVVNVRATLVLSPFYALFLYLQHFHPDKYTTLWATWMLNSALFYAIYFGVLYRECKTMAGSSEP